MTATTNDIAVRLATLADEDRVCYAFAALIKELAPLGHDVLPTSDNVDLYWRDIFRPAILTEKHGIVLALTEDDTCIGVTFFVPEVSPVETPPGRAIAHGAWVSPDYRRRGVGLAMQEHAHNRLREAGCTQLISNVVADNVAGLASARKAGARITGVATTVYL